MNARHRRRKAAAVMGDRRKRRRAELFVAYFSFCTIGYLHFQSSASTQSFFVVPPARNEPTAPEPLKNRLEEGRRELLDVAAYMREPEEPKTPDQLADELVTMDGDKILHVFKTRFMQHQPDLIELGLARLKLFQTFTLPAMEAQTNKGFTWLIRTDPNLHQDLKKPFLETINNSTIKDRVVLMSQNSNPGSFHQTNRLNKTDIWIGDYDTFWGTVQKAKNAEIAVMETSLDADDALPNDFVEYIHSQVKQHLTEPTDWMYWCSHYHMEWQVTADKPPARRRRRRRRRRRIPEPPPSTTTTSPYGHIMTRTASRCITAGLTVVYGKQASRSDLPGVMVHTRIEEMLPACEIEEATRYCVRVMYDSRPGALRARTPTSTGMSQVRLPTKEEEEKSKEFILEQKQRLGPLWDSIEKEYGMRRDDVEATRRLLLDRVTMIAADNLKGQCTIGHSCKENTQQVLKSLAGVQ